MQLRAEAGVLVVAATGRGGVAGAVEAVFPHLGVHATRIPPRPFGRAIWRVASGDHRVVHLHPSLRSRALVRDTALHAVARARGRATVVQIHGWDDGLADRLDPRWITSGLGAADVVAVQVEAHAEALARWGVDPDRIHRVANAYDPRGVADVRVPGPPVALFLGRLVVGKGLPELLEAVAAIDDLRLVIGGEGPERAAVVRTIGRLGLSHRVTLLGWIGPDQRRDWLGSASVLVLPSSSEGFPLAVVEALASGVPVVATETGAVSSLVQDAGRVVGGPAELADALRDVLRAPPVAAVERARERIRATCAPEVVARQWTALYQAAMVGGGSRS